jgi:hypothetical protein
MGKVLNLLDRAVLLSVRVEKGQESKFDLPLSAD